MRVNLEPMTHAAGVDIFFYGAPLCCAHRLLPAWLSQQAVLATSLGGKGMFW